MNEFQRILSKHFVQSVLRNDSVSFVFFMRTHQRGNDNAGVSTSSATPRLCCENNGQFVLSRKFSKTFSASKRQSATSQKSNFFVRENKETLFVIFLAVIEVIVVSWSQTAKLMSHVCCH